MRLRSRGLLLKNLRWHSEGRDGDGDLRLRHGRIVETGRGLASRRFERVLDASGHVALPGLINAHDHLGLNLFPALGRPPYENFLDWAEDVYRPDAPAFREVQRVGPRDRLWWGAYRNLVGGVTTVVHHDPYQRWVFGRQLLGRRLVQRKLFGQWYPIRVLERYAWCHSLAGPALGYGEDPVCAHRRAGRRPFVLHAAEGTDARAFAEVDRLDELGLLGAKTVLVHAIALTEAQRQRLTEAGVAVVWCPATHLRLYERTTAVDELIGRVEVCLGTDSTLTGSPTLLHELRVAASTQLAEPAELLEMVTTAAARTFDLGDGRGTLRPGAPADVVLVPDRGGPAAELLLHSAPGDLSWVSVGGRVRLAAPWIAERLELGNTHARVEGERKWIYGDLAGLRQRIAQAVSHKWLDENPLWKMLDSSGSDLRNPPSPDADS